jgi:mycothiol synthase
MSHDGRGSFLLRPGVDVDHLTVQDVLALTALENALAETDGTDEFVDVGSVREQLGRPGLDLVRDTIAVRDGQQLLGYGTVTVAPSPDTSGRARVRIGGGVRPDHRRQGIGTRILAFQERRAQELLDDRHPGVPAHIHVSGGLEGAGVRYMLEHHGYRPVRVFQDLHRELPGESLVPPRVPDGIELVSPTDEHREAVREAHNAAFRDHWGSAPTSTEVWAAEWGSHTARHELSSIAVDSDGRVLAYAMADQWLPDEVYIALVGTRREARGRGLATAVLSRTLQLSIAAGGFDHAALGVDADSPTGAHMLYEKLGFTLHKAFTTYAKDLG